MKILIILLTVVTVLTGCFFGTAIEKTVTPTIRAIGIPLDINIGSMTLTVTDSDSVIIVEETYTTLPTEITIEVPEGNGINFELTIQLADAFIAVDPGAATSYTGTDTVDISVDSAVVTLNMRVGSTKLVVPDYYFNNRVLQFDDISDTTSIVLNSASPVFGAWLTAGGLQFRPYDIDFDNEGKIYIANNLGGSGMGSNCVIRVDDITGINPINFTEPEYDYGVIALTVDRRNNFVYYATSAASLLNSILNRSALDGTGEIELDVTTGVASIDSIQGMTMDENGIIYISGTTPATDPTVFRYDPVLQSVTASYTMPNAITNNPWDVIAKDDFVYITNPDGADGWKIIQLTPNLTTPVGYGIDKTEAMYSPDTAPGHFYHPRRFVAVLNKKLTIIDDRYGEELDKLVSIDDILGTNWETLPATGDGQSMFFFYVPC